MKVLAIDAGNSRIKWGWFDSARWAAQGWIATGEADKLGTALTAVTVADAVVVANVAGEAARSAIEKAVSPLQVTPCWVQAQARQCGVVSSYADPAQLGADRWAALIGAWHLVQGPCAVVNAGTTLTVDALSGEGVFLGGCIVPGQELMRAALARGTAQLPLQDGKFAYFPDCTADAIASGAVNALAGAVERMLQYMERTCGAPPAVLLSGGAAPLIAPQLNAPVQVVDNLVLEGLLRIAQESSAVSSKR